MCVELWRVEGAEEWRGSGKQVMGEGLREGVGEWRGSGEGYENENGLWEGGSGEGYRNKNGIRFQIVGEIYRTRAIG
jgi:hypothetical protein